MSEGILIQLSLKFSAKIIKLQQYLIKQKKETNFKTNNKKCNKYRSKYK